jgi:hypothetical protein
MECPEHAFVDVVDFLQQVQRYPNFEWIYRGQADAAWPLMPKAGRPEYFDPTWEEERLSEPGIPLPLKDLGRFYAWRRRAVAYSGSIPQDDFECLALAQHYGLATRLLDWTTNPLVALYFAAETHQDTDGAVYCYLPWRSLKGEPYYLDAVRHVVHYAPRPFDQRVLVQDAVFTIHPQPSVPLTPDTLPPESESNAPECVDLVRFRVVARAKSIILRQLSDIGVNRKRLFPDLEGLSAFINWETRQQVEAKEKPVE